MIAVIIAVAVLLVKVKVMKKHTMLVTCAKISKKLKPYDYEPLVSSLDESDSELESDFQVQDDSHKGKKFP